MIAILALIHNYRQNNKPIDIVFLLRLKSIKTHIMWSIHSKSIKALKEAIKRIQKEKEYPHYRKNKYRKLVDDLSLFANKKIREHNIQTSQF